MRLESGLAATRKGRKLDRSRLTSLDRSAHPRRGSRPFQSKEVRMAATVTHSLVQQFASMKPNEFGPTIEPKWQVGERLLKEVKTSVEKGYLTPLDGARLI